MVIPKETLTDLKEQYEKSYKYVDEESQNDPASDPYRSHYVARDILTQIMENLINSIHSEEDPENVMTLKCILSFVYRDLGRINAFCEESDAGEKYFQKCLELIDEYKMKPEGVISCIGTLNEMGIIWCNRLDHKKAKECLDQAEKYYNEFKDTGLNALTVFDLFGTKEEIEVGKGTKEFDKLFTLTAYYLAQVLGHLGELALSAMYCNLTLKRQLESKDYDSIDWALNAATLSQYFLSPNQFSLARHHLSAATLILDMYEAKTILAEVAPDMTEDAKAALIENFRHRYSDVARCWVKYCIVLLSSSKERLMNDDEEKLNKDMDNLSLDKTKYRFQELNLEAYENKVTDKYCLTFDDAKLVFQFAAHYVEKAEEYYNAETEASEYGRIVADHAELYKILAFFEEDPSNQSKIQKKRADLLEHLIHLFNPTYYLLICRECWYELAHSYTAILDIKLDALAQLKFDETPSTHQVHKINLLCGKAIKNFQSFIESFMETGTDNFKSNVENDEKQLILFSYFHIGRLFYKIITHQKQKHLHNLQNSLKYYKLFVDGCEKEPEASKPLQGEIGVCKEMVKLLPLKIKKTVNEIAEGIP